MIGTIVSHYRIIEKLGEGGMGVVYKAQDTKLNRFVALKFLPANVVASADDVARFEQEAHAISSLNHPNIATIHDIDESNGQKFLVLEYISGGTLKAKLHQYQVAGKEFSLADVVEYGIEIAEGLASAHKEGILHRDIKTDNVMLTKDGKVKLTDFGLAKLQGASQLTKTGSTIGTAAYMSPEQIRGEDTDARSDLFSFGVVMYELATGRLPFRGEHQASLSYSIVNEDPTPLKSLRQQIPPLLERVIARCLEKNPAKRYQRAEDIVGDLRKVQQEISGTVTVAKPRLKLQWIVAGGALLLLAAGFYFLLQSKSTAVDRKSIAVLPFQNFNEDKESEFFSDGITEDIITQLSKIADLKVIARTSVMRYKNSDKDLRVIGKELGVATILEGSVRRIGNQLRIVGQLIDAQTNEHIWADTYDREMKDVFEIQSDVAQKIAGVLRAKLSASEKERIEKKPTSNLDAYACYLRGREYYYRYVKEDNESAVELFKKALQLDPQYALAYAGLGDAYGQRVSKFGFDEAWLDSSIVVSQKAIAIDAGLAEAYKSLALAYNGKGWNARSLENNQKSVELNPNYVPAVGNIGFNLSIMGRHDEALVWMKKSIVLSPSFTFQYFGTAWVYEQLTEDSSAEAWYRKGLQLQPDFLYGRLGLIRLDVAQKKFQKAIEESRIFLSSRPDDLFTLNAAGDAALFAHENVPAEKYYRRAVQISPKGSTEFMLRDFRTGLAYIDWRNGKREEARQLLDQKVIWYERRMKEGSEAPEVRFDLALIYAIQGKKPEAYRWMKEAIDKGWTEYRVALLDPILEEFQSDQQFQQMMAQVKASVDRMKLRAEAQEKQ